jgi:hypothetical protein
MFRSGVLVLIGVATLTAAQQVRELDLRYRIEVNTVNYPQKTPQEALKSIVKALDADAYEYMLAQLVDPKFVDMRVAEYKATMFPPEILRQEDEAIAREVDPKVRRRMEIEKELRERDRIVVAFARLAKETRKHFGEDPVLLRELRLMARDGKWEADEEKGICSLEKIVRKAFFKAREGRFFMEEKQQ